MVPPSEELIHLRTWTKSLTQTQPRVAFLLNIVDLLLNKAVTGSLEDMTLHHDCL